MSREFLRLKPWRARLVQAPECRGCESSECASYWKLVLLDRFNDHYWNIPAGFSLIYVVVWKDFRHQFPQARFFLCGSGAGVCRELVCTYLQFDLRVFDQIQIP